MRQAILPKRWIRPEKIVKGAAVRAGRGFMGVDDGFLLRAAARFGGVPSGGKRHGTESNNFTSPKPGCVEDGHGMLALGTKCSDQLAQRVPAHVSC